MPVAVVLHLRALREGALYGATGRHVHGFWLRTWGMVDPPTGDALHDARRLRPFTLSPLGGLPLPHHGRTPVATGAAARVRVTALDDRTQDRLLRRWLPQAPRRLTLGGIPWRLEGVAVAPEEDEDAGWERFAVLRERHADGRAPRRWSLAFLTPTALSLRSGDVLPFPLPGPLVGGWLDRWREVSDVALPEVDVAALGAALRISAYDLRTVSARFWDKDARGRRVEWPEIGCVGTMTLDGGQLSAEERAVVGALADFAFYCGSGHHTTMGMGQTRVTSDE